MHPDEAVQLALRDLRGHAPRIRLPARTGARRPVLGLLRAYVRLLGWYVQEGRTPPAAGGTEVGHLPRPDFRAEPRRGTAREPVRVPPGMEACR